MIELAHCVLTVGHSDIVLNLGQCTLCQCEKLRSIICKLSRKSQLQPKPENILEVAHL